MLNKKLLKLLLIILLDSFMLFIIRFFSELFFNRVVHWLLALVYIENRLQEIEIERVSI
jgi:hypothetical protein